MKNLKNNEKLTGLNKPIRDDYFSDDVFTCSICGNRFIGFGHNPYPVTKGEEDLCCSACDSLYVIPARMKARNQ